MKIVFAVTHFGFLRNFEHALMELARRGHSIHLVADRKESLGGMRTLENLERAVPGAFTWQLAAVPKGSSEHALATTLRLAQDYWRYLAPEYAGAGALRERAATQVPPAAVRVGNGLLRGAAVRRMAMGCARALERAVPDPAYAEQVLRERAPDVVMLTPLLYFGSPQVDYVRAARRLGIPSVLCVGSWDHLTTKGLIHEVPDALTVWNEAQRDEAARLHGVPRERVHVTGSPAYDHWFAAAPTLSREAFCARVGLPPDRPILLYLCSSPFIAPREVGFVRRWLDTLRTSGDDRLRDVSVLVRPHPQNAEQWRGEDVSARGPAAIWPREGSNPVDREARADYFHSMYFSVGVVGVNTSALIESGIVGRPVFSVATGDFAGTQEGTLHFQHLKNVEGGLLTMADSLEAHAAQLRALLGDPASFQQPGRSFIEAFIRPHGLDRPVAPIVADAVEQIATRQPAAASRPGSLALRPMVWALAPVARWVRSRQRRRRAEGEERPAGKRRVLFVMASPEYLRFFDDTLAALAARGHDVAVAVGGVKDLKPVRVREDDAASKIRFLGLAPVRRDRWAPLARALRGTMDFVRYLDPRFAGAPVLRTRMKRKALPYVLRWMDAFSTLPPAVVRTLLRMMAWGEHVIPPDKRIVRFVEEVQPDVMVVSPLVDAASEQVDLVRAARRCRVPAVAAIASWDNLTNKGLLRIEPDRVAVWNPIQQREAIELHGVSESRVTVTGAQPFDRWFGRQPSTTREAFCAPLDLDPSRPIVLFTGSSFFISGEQSEAPFVRRWIEALRRAPNDTVRQANVLIRPHPYNAAQWLDADFSDFGRVAVFPRGRHDPTDETNRTGYFDSIYHAAAVVGINTSAMVEATIVGRPVHSLMTGDFDATQEGTIHFRYLLPEHGGFLQVARTFDEHIAKLARSLEHPAEAAAPLQRFVQTFLRPGGAGSPAVPQLAAAIEDAANLTPLPLGDGVTARTARVLCWPVAAGSDLIARSLGRASGVSSKELKKKWRMAVHHRRKRLSSAWREVPKRLSKSARRARHGLAHAFRNGGGSRG